MKLRTALKCKIKTECILEEDLESSNKFNSIFGQNNPNLNMNNPWSGYASSS